MQNAALTRLLFAQGRLCFFCKEPLPETEASVEHLVAKANGGGDQDENCVACCKSLNALLGSMSLKEKIQVVLNQTRPFECPNGAERKVEKMAPEVLANSTQVGAERHAQVAAHLKRLGKARPRTVAKLKNVIAALFQNKLSQHEVDALVRELKSQRVISIKQAKLTYLSHP